MKLKNDKLSKISYESLWKYIIRPPRDNYSEELIGNAIFSFRGKTYVRKDYDIISSEGYNMKCSFFEPDDADRPTKIMPVVLYLHGNSSSRLEGIGMLTELLRRDINLFVIDFPGCGLSEGEYISLGYHESHDVKIVVDFIEKIPGVGQIGIWGRSMGAATTMIYSHKDDRIKAICMDSPFYDFSVLAKELVLKQIKLPVIFIEGALKIIRITIKKKNGLDIEKLKPLDAAGKTTQPALFIHANNDELINNQHSQILLDAYKGTDKVLNRCEGKHNTRRPNKLIREIGGFFYKHLYNKMPGVKINKSIFNLKELFNEKENDIKSEDKNKTESTSENNNKDQETNKETNENDSNKIKLNDVSCESESGSEIIYNENSFENEKHSIQKEESHTKEMKRLSNDLTKYFEDKENQKHNIDINNDVDEENNNNV